MTFFVFGLNFIYLHYRYNYRIFTIIISLKLNWIANWIERSWAKLFSKTISAQNTSNVYLLVFLKWICWAFLISRHNAISIVYFAGCRNSKHKHKNQYTNTRSHTPHTHIHSHKMLTKAMAWREKKEVRITKKLKLTRKYSKLQRRLLA